MAEIKWKSAAEKSEEEEKQPRSTKCKVQKGKKKTYH